MVAEGFDGPLEPTVTQLVVIGGVLLIMIILRS